MIYSTILAGGRGTRLWPLSRTDRPKFLHPLTGTDRSLLQNTFDRVAEVSAREQIFVVTGSSHATAVSRQLPSVPEENILVEPAPRDSCAAIGLAAALLARRDPDAVIGVFPADHLIDDNRSFAATIRAAAGAAGKGFITTIGIRPTRPEVGFGYLQIGGPASGGAFQVREFKEKPSHELAVGYVDSGGYLWNGGMIVTRTDVFLAEVERQRPALFDGLVRIAAAWGTPQQDAVMAATWPSLERISVDYGVLEGAAPAGRVACIPADFAWSDVGDFHSLGTSLPPDDAGNVVLGGQRCDLLLDTKDTVVVGTQGRVIATVGIEDLVIVDTPDALLVIPRSRAQDVKAIVDELERRRDSGLL